MPHNANKRIIARKYFIVNLRAEAQVFEIVSKLSRLKEKEIRLIATQYRTGSGFYERAVKKKLLPGRPLAMI